MTSARFSTIWALAFLVSAGAAQAAEPAAGSQEGLAGLQGFISSERGEPLVGAIVSVFGAHLSSGLITVSDENGNFGIDDLPPGLYTLRAYLSGFLPSRSSSVEVTQEGQVVEPVSVKLARLQVPTALRPVSVTDGNENPDETGGSFEENERRASELKWILRHGKKNVLHEKEAPVVEQVAENSPPQEPYLFPGIELNGEFGVLASGFEGLVSNFPGSGAGLDARLAYAKLDIPTGPNHHWEVNAQLMESILSSWAGSATFVMDRQSGNFTAAGVSYGNHLYGDLDEYRPPEAALGNRPMPEHSTEWFGSVFGNHRFHAGPATVDAGLTYHHYSYLGDNGYAAPRVEVSWAPVGNDRTLLRGLVDYRVLAPGSEDLNLLAKMVSADFVGTETTQKGLRAEKTMRAQVSLQQRIGEDSIVELRLFQEEAVAQLVKVFMQDQPNAAGRFVVSNQGDYRTRGVGVAVSRRFGSVASSVGYRFGLARALTPASARSIEGEEGIHDLTTSVETQIDCTRTRLMAMYRLISHPSFFPGAQEAGSNNLNSRFNVQIYQMLPFVGWNQTEFEVMLAIRNLFYEDLDAAALLDESAVIDSPRRLLGGVSVRF